MRKSKLVSFLVVIAFAAHSHFAFAAKAGEESFEKALAFGVKGEFSKAKKELKKAVGYRPRIFSFNSVTTVIDDVLAKKAKRHTAGLIFRAFVVMNKEDKKKGVEYLTMAVKNEPNYAFVYYIRGQLYRMSSLNNKALQDLATSLQRGNDTAVVHQYLGRLYKEQGLYDFAIISLTTAIKMDPKNRYNYFDRAEVYNEMKQHDNALEDITRAIATAPKVTSGYYFRAYTYMTYLNDMPNACKDYKKACDLGDCGYYNEMCK